MFKNTLVAIAAVATLGATALASTQAFACEYGYGDGSYGGYGYGYDSYPSYRYDIYSQPVYSLPLYGYDVYSQPVYSLPSYDYGYDGRSPDFPSHSQFGI